MAFFRRDNTPGNQTQTYTTFLGHSSQIFFAFRIRLIRSYSEALSGFMKYLRYNARADWLATMFISEGRDMARTETLEIFYKSNIK